MSSRTHTTSHRRAGIWEVSLGTLPLPSSPPLPQEISAVFLVEHESYFIFGMEATIERDKTAAFRNAIKNAIERNHMCPVSFMVKEVDRAALAPVAEELGVSITIATKLPASVSVKRATTSMLRDQMDAGADQVKHELGQNLAPKSHGRDIYQFKITLNHVKPSVWRRIRVPSDFSFGELSLAIMEAFGWAPGYHLHGYAIQPVKTNLRDIISVGPPNPDGNDWGMHRDERETFIADFFGKSIKQCTFTYDYGDNWDHIVLFEGDFPPESGVSYPQITGGKNATPPDDCGGPGGYENLRKILTNPRHKEHKEMLEWLAIDDSSDFNPEHFDSAEITFGSRSDYQKFLKDYRGIMM